MIKDMLSRWLPAKKSVALLDGDREWLRTAEKLLQQEGVEVKTYVYPQQHQEFLDEVGRHTHICIDHRLGGHNGANVVRNLLMGGVIATMIIISDADSSDRYEKLDIFLTKSHFMENPSAIFELDVSPSDVSADTVWLALQTPEERC